jgi:hypothetical protein
MKISCMCTFQGVFASLSYVYYIAEMWTEIAG